MKSRQQPWKWILAILVGAIVLPLIALLLGILLVTPARVERSSLPAQEATMGTPAIGESIVIPPADAADPPLLSLSPQNPIHIFVILPLIAALILFPIGGVGGLLWWWWLRPKNDATDEYRTGNGKAKTAKVRYVFFGLLLWGALSILFIFDLLGSVSLYPPFVAIYAAFWVLVGALLLYDRRLREKVLILIVFLALVFSLRSVDWNSRKPFLRRLYRIEEGMTYTQVERIMGSYRGSVGGSAKVDGEGHLITGSVSYTHTDEGWGNSDIGMVTFQDGRVAETDFLPD
jgi:hypothetical protein